MDTCIFCKIAKGEVPSEKVYEDEQFVAFLDVHPVAQGHTLLVPKEHHRWFYELPEGLYDALFRTAKKLVPTLKEQYTADYIKLGIVGADVPHVHVHLIPRRLSDIDTHP